MRRWRVILWLAPALALWGCGGEGAPVFDAYDYERGEDAKWVIEQMDGEIRVNKGGIRLQKKIALPYRGADNRRTPRLGRE